MLQTRLAYSAILDNAVERLSQGRPLLKTRLDQSLQTLVPKPNAYIPKDGDRSTQHLDALGTLNMNGFPVEFTFASHDPSLRYTCEVESPELSPNLRLDRAIQLLSQLGVYSSGGDTWASIARVQQGDPLKWGAWIGVRHAAKGDRHKLYIQVPESMPPSARTLINQYVTPLSGFDQTAFKLVAVGYPMDDSRIEFYFRFEATELHMGQVALLMQSLGYWHQYQPLMVAIKTLQQDHRVGTPTILPEGTYGFSVSCSLEQSEPPIFSWFAYPLPLCGDDLATREVVLGMAQHYRWDFSRYRALTQSMPIRQDDPPHHNAIALIVPPQGPFAMHVSLSPPATVMGARSASTSA
ncbi:MAG: hypothetical protein AAGD25_24510 [Cyanobacteria bacterium P01_F01_bin.150]